LAPVQVEQIEQEIGCGQVEELIEEAKGELVLIPEYASWKAWERSRPTPDDDEYQDFYEDLEMVDPDSVGAFFCARGHMNAGSVTREPISCRLSRT
jgi:hypothetical protein